MAQKRLNDNLHWLLLRVSLKAKHALMKIADSYELTVMQVITILRLEPGTSVPMHSISGLLSCDPSNVTGIVDRLLERKYIHRHEGAEDRRVKAIGLTASGIALREKVLRKMSTGNVPDITVLSASDTKALKKILLKIAPETD